MQSIEVAIIEDNDDIREALRLLINGSNGFRCTETFARGKEAVAALPGLDPDVVLVDINMPDMSGIECVRILKPLMPAAHFMMETVYQDDENIFNALRAGATGYLLKKTTAVKMLEAITEIFNGGSPMSAEVARRVVASLQDGNKELPAAVLTSRETEVLKLLAKGLVYKEIAAELMIEYETVKKHIQNIYSKLHVQNKVEAINKAFPK